jgi:uncharacterized membrane protein
MTHLWLQLLGARVEDAVGVAKASLAFRGGVDVGWVILLLLVLGAVSLLAYRQSPPGVSASRRYLLAGLRTLFLGLILLLLLRPVLALTVEGSVRRVLVLLFDSSASMQIKDPRVDAADQQRAALAQGLLEPAKGLSETGGPALNLPPVERIALVKQVLQNPQLNLLPRLDREFDLAVMTFGQGLVELSARKVETNAPASKAGPARRDGSPYPPGQFPWVAGLSATNPATAIGDALREVLNRKRGQPLAGVLLVTDGANNSGSPPREFVGLYRQEGVPLYAYGAGITQPRDIIVANLFAPDVTFVKDEALATVRVRSQGLAGQTAEVVLKLDGQKAASREITLSNAGEEVVPLRFTPQTEGEFDLEAAIEPRQDETVKDNNSRTQRLRVIDAKIHVLLMDQSPRWEFHYLQAMLLRDRRIELKCCLVEGDPGIARWEKTPYIAGFPARKEELFAYDLVILGDLDPKALSTAQLENLNEWVSKFGGALVVVAGKRFTPMAYKQTLLERLLPVEFEAPTLGSTQDPQAEKPIQLELTSLGRASPMLRLADQDDVNAQLWKHLPPVYWVARVARPKPAAQVLLVDPDPAKESRFGKMPVVAAQQYGLGQVLFVGTDNTWRWRKNIGDQYYTTLWGQMFERVSLQRLLGGSKRTQLTTDRQNFLTGDRISIYARLYGVGFEPVQEPAIKGLCGFKNGQGARSEVTLRPVPEQPGLYRAELVAGAPGHYQFFVEPDPDTPLDFTVTEPKFELGETAMNEPLLRELAAASGGAFFREEDLDKLPETIARKTERVRSPLEVELWASPLYFLGLLGVVTVEWVLRKRSFLK